MRCLVVFRKFPGALWSAWWTYAQREPPDILVASEHFHQRASNHLVRYHSGNWKIIKVFAESLDR